MNAERYIFELNFLDVSLIMKKNPFTIRVYGIYHEKGRGILVSDELINGNYFTKFPGGGLDFGEGTLECLKREMMEETGHEFEVGQHFYTTDFFVPSAFDNSLQVFSIYYQMKPIGEFKKMISVDRFDFVTHEHGAQSFRFVPISEIREDTFTLVIDQKVGEIIKGNYLEEK